MSPNPTTKAGRYKKAAKLNSLVFLLVFCFGFFLSASAQDLGLVQARLEAIADSSQTLRDKVMPTIREFGAGSPEMAQLNKAILKFDSVSLAEVTRVLDLHGWLGISEVGPKANLALFLAIQHAAENSYRQRYFPLFEVSARKGESSLANMATMHDRMLVEAGEKQLYGTQYQLVNGKQKLFPVHDKMRLNKRRKTVKLPRLGLF